MKKRGMALLLTAVLLLPVTACFGQADAVEDTISDGGVTSGETSASFAEQLAELIEKQDNKERDDGKRNADTYFYFIDLTLNETTMKKDGEEIELDAAPELKNSRTMLPIRAVAEAAGATVEYDGSTKTAIITSLWGDKILCTVNNDVITVNGVEQKLEASSYVKAGRTYLPLRAITEAMGLEVQWNQETKRIHITAPYQTARVVAWGETIDTDALQPQEAINDEAGLWVLQFSTPADAKKAVETLTANGISAGPDEFLYVAEPDAISFGEKFETQYGEAEGSSWGLIKCGFDDYLQANADKWANLQGTVAVIDTGIDANHALLKDRLLPGKDFVDGDNDPNQADKHGTQIAGVIAECTGDAPVKILPIRALNRSGIGYVSCIAAAVQYAAEQKVDVINLSLGGSASGGAPLHAAIQKALKKGITIVTSAGNDNQDTSTNSPGCMTDAGVLVVTAGDENRAKADFSNYGKNVDVMAPGVNVMAAVPAGYLPIDGTGTAAAHVSAAVMLVDLATAQKLEPAKLEQQLLTTGTTKKQWTDEQSGYGFLELVEQPLEPEPLEPNPDSTYRRLYWGISYADMNMDLDLGAQSATKISLSVGTKLQVDVYGEKETGEVDNLTTRCGVYSNNPEIVSLTETGELTAVAAGETYIYIQSAPNTGLTLPPPLEIVVE